MVLGRTLVQPASNTSLRWSEVLVGKPLVTDVTSLCRSSASTNPSCNQTILAGNTWHPARAEGYICCMQGPSKTGNTKFTKSFRFKCRDGLTHRCRLLACRSTFPTKRHETNGSTLCSHPFVRTAHPSCAPRKASALVHHRWKVETQPQKGT